ncbi:MAG: hypothetical protein P8Y29_10760 [Gemmatimonadota bacterium]
MIERFRKNRRIDLEPEDRLRDLIIVELDFVENDMVDVVRRTGYDCVVPLRVI